MAGTAVAVAAVAVAAVAVTAVCHARPTLPMVCGPCPLKLPSPNQEQAERI